MISKTHYDCVIVGAGPAGTMASAFLSKEGIPHLLIDKSTFPRDKICGDALSGKVLPILKKLNGDIVHSMMADTTHFMPSHGIRFAAPDGNYADIPFRTATKISDVPPGFIVKRLDFDHFLHRFLDQQRAECVFGASLENVSRADGGLSLEISDGNNTTTLQTKLLIAADGVRSKIPRLLAGHQLEPKHHCAGVRAYYSGVTGFREGNFIELHFLKSMLPGYLWIFPLPNGEANVGAGILSDVVSKRKINLRKAFNEAIQNDPGLRDRFAKAKQLTPIEGWGLPLGSKKRTLSGDHFMLTGDAGSMIDPFTGEGISNAMYCGMRAAEFAALSIKTGNYGAGFLRSYDMAIYQRLWGELKISYTLQKLCKYPGLFNRVIRKASSNREFRETITCMFEDMDLRSKLTSPSFYFRLLFGGN